MTEMVNSKLSMKEKLIQWKQKNGRKSSSSSNEPLSKRPKIDENYQYEVASISSAKSSIMEKMNQSTLDFISTMFQHHENMVKKEITTTLHSELKEFEMQIKDPTNLQMSKQQRLLESIAEQVSTIQSTRKMEDTSHQLEDLRKEFHKLTNTIIQKIQDSESHIVSSAVDESAKLRFQNEILLQKVQEVQLKHNQVVEKLHKKEQEYAEYQQQMNQTIAVLQEQLQNGLEIAISKATSLEKKLQLEKEKNKLLQNELDAINQMKSTKTDVLQQEENLTQ